MLWLKNTWDPPCQVLLRVGYLVLDNRGPVVEYIAGGKDGVGVLEAPKAALRPQDVTVECAELVTSKGAVQLTMEGEHFTTREI